MQTSLIDKYGNKKQINYYELESECIKIINNLDNDLKNKFNEFKLKYKDFNPYFDFVIMYLGYCIENPMGYDNCLLISNNEKIYIFKNNNYINNKIYETCFTSCDNQTLNISKVTYNINEFDNGLINKNNIFISNKDMLTHSDTAEMILNQILISNKQIYEEYIVFENFGNKAIDFLERKFGFIRFGFNEKILLEYSESALSYKQRDYISYLKSNDYVEYILDKDDKIKIM
ncbi:MAG: hypothetical protein PHN42_06235 [Bacilli bacterium]|nr:hypothetical protein [Bacilli bacterium]